ncbi:MAG: hypothetical protein ACD_79C01306G0001 [uncultured bacterium]|nr:MAG: hypothetical protein ACD_79C01306G0001 [uncultured bacterium]
MKRNNFIAGSFNIKKKKNGFSAIEMFIVLTLILILASIIIFSYKSVIAKANVLACAKNMRTVWQAMMLYTEDFPDSAFPPPNKSDAREIYGALYYPQSEGMAGGLTNFKAYVCPATNHLPPTAAEYKTKLICDATDDNKGYYNPNYTGSSIDYWIVKKQRNFNSDAFYDLPDVKKVPTQNVILIEASDIGSGYHHPNGRNLVFSSGSVKFIASTDPSKYPINVFYGSNTANDGKPEQVAGTIKTVVADIDHYAHPNQ